MKLTIGVIHTEIWPAAHVPMNFHVKFVYFLLLFMPWKKEAEASAEVAKRGKYVHP